LTAYEYVADSEEYHSTESTVSSTHEAIERAVSEPLTEDMPVIEGYEMVSVADVHWCLPGLTVTQSSEVASQFCVDAVDGQTMTEHKYTDELLSLGITDRTQTLVTPQLDRFSLQ